MPYSSVINTVARLPESMRLAMIALYFRCYQGSDQDCFLRDLADKDEALLLYHDNQLVGFTTMKYYRFREYRIVFSGDTVVLPEHWRQQSLHRSWIARMGQLFREEPQTPLYWFLLVKGQRTFKYLSVFARRFFPHWQFAEPDLQALASELAEERFGSLYNAASGVVECPAHYGHLTPELAQPAHSATQADEFFFRHNPDYAKGHELVCLCPLSADNLKPRFRSWFQAERAEAVDG